MKKASQRWIGASADRIVGTARVWALVPVALSVLACSDVGDEAVATARGETLTVDQVVDLLTDQPQLPADEGVVRALAELWVNYTLLGVAAREDATLGSLDLASVIAPRVDQELILALRQAVIHVDTVLADDELRYLFERDQPGVQVKARHILLNFDMTRAESRDSAVAVADELRARLLAGADFAAIARQYSKDPATASAGGDLGDPFPRERMVAPFSEAAFALEPGEVSQPVETQFGIHLIRVDRRDVPDFDQVRESFRNAVKNRRMEVAESTYVAGIDEPAAPEVVPTAYEVVRELARDPGQRPTRRAENAALVEYEGGTYTAGEFLQFIRNQSPAYRSQVTLAPNTELDQMLEGLTRGELLVARALEEGLDLAEERRDSLESEARAQFLTAVEQLGVASADTSVPPVTDLLREMLAGQRDVIPLGAVGYVLRDRYDGRIIDGGVERSVERITEERQYVAPPVLTPTVEPDTDDTVGSGDDAP